MCAAVLKIDLKNNPQSVQKQAYEKYHGQMNEKFHRVFKTTPKAYQSLTMIQNSSQFLFSCA